MFQEPIPATLRCPLDRMVLLSKLLELNEPPQAILALLLDPPNLSNIESTIWKLKEVTITPNVPRWLLLPEIQRSEFNLLSCDFLRCDRTIFYHIRP